MYDFLIVGCGLTGSIISRIIAESGKHVLILEKRNHIAGNIYDELDKNGILIQKYGPHIFHTNDKAVMNFLSKFAKWDDFFLECMVYMEGKFTPSPFNFQTIDDYFSESEAADIKESIKQEYKEREFATIVEMLESKNENVRKFADFLFANDYSLYTAKQWGISPEEIDISILKRVPVLFSYKTGYFSDTYQCMPADGFTNLIKRMLDHPNIDVKLNTNATEHMSFNFDSHTICYDGEELSCPVAYTGALDELFGYKFGRLPYRSLRFEWETYNTASYQSAPVVAYPQADGYTRITEYNKLPVQKTGNVTTVAIEYPLQSTDKSDAEPYYPIPTNESQASYSTYKEEAQKFSNLYLCGRLAEYRYYNMDQAAAVALELAKNLVK